MSISHTTPCLLFHRRSIRFRSLFTKKANRPHHIETLLFFSLSYWFITDFAAMECEKVREYLIQVSYKRSQRSDTFQWWNSTAQSKFLVLFLFVNSRGNDGERFNPGFCVWKPAGSSQSGVDAKRTKPRGKPLSEISLERFWEHRRFQLSFHKSIQCLSRKNIQMHYFKERTIFYSPSGTSI